jgi:hypothetical protein
LGLLNPKTKTTTLVLDIHRFVAIASIATIQDRNNNGMILEEFEVDRFDDDLVERARGRERETIKHALC